MTIHNIPIIVIGLFTVFLYTSLIINAKKQQEVVTFFTVIILTIGTYLSVKYMGHTNWLKRYVFILFFLAYLKIGHTDGFKTHWWEFLLIFFAVGRFGIDILRPNFDMTGAFGGMGDYLFFTTAYLYHKKSTVKHPDSRQYIFRLILAVSLIIAFIGIIEYVFHWDLFSTPKSRFIIESHHRSNSIFNAPEIFGTNCLFGFLLTLYLYINKHISKKNFINLSILLIIGIFVCFYRGVWLALIIGLVLYSTVYLLNKEGKIKTITTYIFILIGLFVAISTSKYIIPQDSFLYKRASNIKNVNDRFIIYEELWKGIQRNILIGHGTATVKPYLRSLGLDDWYRLGNRTATDTSHNLFLNILFENGIIFLGLFVLWIKNLIRYNTNLVNVSAFSWGVTGAFISMNVFLNLPLSFDLPSYFLAILLANISVHMDADDMGFKLKSIYQTKDKRSQNVFQ